MDIGLGVRIGCRLRASCSIDRLGCRLKGVLGCRFGDICGISRLGGRLMGKLRGMCSLSKLVFML